MFVFFFSYRTNASIIVKQKQHILEWFSSHDFQVKLQSLVEQRVPGTGTWLLEDSKFQRWIEGESESRILWCKGEGIDPFDWHANSLKLDQERQC